MRLLQTLMQATGPHEDANMVAAKYVIQKMRGGTSPRERESREPDAEHAEAADSEPCPVIDGVPLNDVVAGTEADKRQKGRGRGQGGGHDAGDEQHTGSGRHQMAGGPEDCGLGGLDVRVAEVDRGATDHQHRVEE